MRTPHVRAAARLAALCAGAALVVAVAAAEPAAPSADPYPSTYQPAPAAPVLIRGATVLTGTGDRLDDTDVVVADGKIAAVGQHLAAPAGARIVEARGRWVTPGIIDIHSHLGVYPTPQVSGNSDGNEATSPVTANVWAEHSGVAGRTRASTRRSPAASPRSRSCRGRRQPDRRPLGRAQERAGRDLPGDEVPRRAAGPQDGLRREPQAGLRRRPQQAPSTRMGNVAGYRAQWIEAAEYLRD